MDPLLELAIQQVPSVALATIVIISASKGIIRFSSEVDAWRERSLRAESQVDKLIPAIETLTTACEKLMSVVEEALQELGRR